MIKSPPEVHFLLTSSFWSEVANTEKIVGLGFFFFLTHLIDSQIEKEVSSWKFCKMEKRIKDKI